MRLAPALRCMLLFGTVACSSFSAADSNPTDAGVPAEAGAEAGTPSTLGAGLLARWRFDEGKGATANNDVATAPKGAISDATWGTGMLGGALVFNGTSSKVEVMGSPTLDVTTAFTLALWANVADLSTELDPRLVSRGPLDLKLNGGKPQISISATTYAASSFAIPVNGWHHITAVYAANKAQIYVDGIISSLVEDTFTGELLAPTTGSLWIGVREGGSGFFSGRLDDVRLWSRALSAAEIAALFLER